MALVCLSVPRAVGSLTLSILILTLTLRIIRRFSAWHLLKLFIHFKSKEIERNGSSDFWRCVPDINTKKCTENNAYFQKYFCSLPLVFSKMFSSLCYFVWMVIPALHVSWGLNHPGWVWNTEAHFRQIICTLRNCGFMAWVSWLHVCSGHYTVFSVLGSQSVQLSSSENLSSNTPCSAWTQSLALGRADHTKPFQCTWQSFQSSFKYKLLAKESSAIFSLLAFWNVMLGKALTTSFIWRESFQ